MSISFLPASDMRLNFTRLNKGIHRFPPATQMPIETNSIYSDTKAASPLPVNTEQSSLIISP